MHLMSLVLLLGSALTADGDRHSLTYIYTAFSKPVPTPGLHEFTAMGLLDNRMIDYYDSSTKVKVPKQDWMREKLDNDYWNKGTQSRQSKEQWFKVNINILKNRMRQNDTDLHVLQWRHGCVADVNGITKFQSGVDSYSYDGNDFLSFDDEHKDWVTGNEFARETKRKWDDVKVLKEYTIGYLHRECVDWLNKFVVYGDNQMREASSPKVHVFAKEAKTGTTVVLTCLATGFYPKDITLWIKRDERIVTKDDGLVSSGVRPNNDETFQIRDEVEILKSDTAVYTCEVIHRASKMYVKKTWDHKLPSSDGGIIGGAVGGLLLLLLLGVGVGVYLLCKKKRQHLAPAGATTAKSASSSQSSDSALGAESGGSSASSSSSSKDSLNAGAGNPTGREADSLLKKKRMSEAEEEGEKEEDQEEEQ
ncbi:BOLA class I histocompatibility antigen, alpha chain BL3-6-like isoform X2 [Genypterus blacodes]|uniref:BOLA class I histocompatibility antigen, alpha chain BL3-6-like isoform X2 n=1 Tax=Genypterus blacodes TaxID=154954 RepID=UPI003F7712AA